MKHIVSGSRAAVLALAIALMLGSGASNADDATPPGEKPRTAEDRQRLLDDIEATIAAIEEREAKESAIEAKAADTRSDDEVRHVALDHPDTEALIAGLKAKSAYFADALEGSQERLRRELVARMKAEAKDPAIAPYWWEDDSSYERFELWADCEPMRVHINNFGDGKLAEAAVQPAVESRLRAARLYESKTGTPRPQLQVSIGRAASGPFSITVQFRKARFDMETGQKGLSDSWRTTSFGTGPPEYVRSALSEHMDTFLAAYLRVNEEACGKTVSP